MLPYSATRPQWVDSFCSQYTDLFPSTSVIRDLYFISSDKMRIRSLQHFEIRIPDFQTDFFQRISLFGKPIHLIEEDAFHGLRTLRFLELVACSLKVMPPVDPVKSNLAYLNLRKNNLVEISPDYFSGFTQLYRVSLAYNRLIALPNFKPVAETLRSLYLDYNNITSLRPSLTNATFPKLFLVHVMYNKISRLNHALFRHLPRLGFLRVDFNLLETLEDMSLMSRENALEVCNKCIISPPSLF